MKHTILLSIFFLFFFSLFGCKESEAEKRKRSIEMMTTQTLGLAYLEEFKLEEAEQEFKKMIELAPDEKLGYGNLGLVYLRMGKYKEAEEQIFKAQEIDPDDADISLLLATVYELEGRQDEAIEVLEDALKKSPGHVKVLYELASLYSKESGSEAGDKRKNYLEQLVTEAPDNLVPHLQLTEILIREGKSDEAIAQLETIRQTFPEFPKEAIEYFDKTKELLLVPDTEKALINFTVFHNYLRVTFTYQSGINELKGPGGSNIGFPLITYNRQASEGTLDDKSILEVLRFKDVTSELGLDQLPSAGGSELNTGNHTHIKAADYNGDGKIDLYVGNFDPAGKSYVPYLFDNTASGFENVAESLNLNHTLHENGALFADYDNDGFLDLYIFSEEGSTLYKNADKGVFEDVTTSTQIKGQGINKALFFDMDQDGDLDLFQADRNHNLAFRNNGDGTFTQKGSEMGISPDDQENTIDAAFGDFDDDGDVDLLTLNDTGDILLYTNRRQGLFALEKDTGFEPVSGIGAIAVGDCNNDGFLDVIIASDQKEQTRLYINQRDGKFKPGTGSGDFSGINGLGVRDVEFLDFDNDGFLDILFAGDSGQKGSGLLLFHNDGAEGYSNVSNLLPDNAYKSTQVVKVDYDNDGDLDIVLALKGGGVKVLRNDGGNLNHYVNMNLVGLRTGSAKNNYFGIGSKVELRSGDLYQSMVVTEPGISFGLGNRSKADIIRITWTNGVPQNILMPDADQALVESQILKGSCPFLYTWNGKEFEFVKDITWRSALGMPLGIMGENTKYAFAEASDDYLKIEGDQLKEREGAYEIRVTSELWETIYMDQIELIAVDHPTSTEIFVPEQFTPPPFPGMELYQIKQKITPSSISDERGKDLLALLSAKDDRYAAPLNPSKFQGLTEMHDLIIDPGKAGSLDNLHLFLRGWIFPTDASINVALSQSESWKVQPPVVQVMNNKGSWQTVSTDISFPMGKDKTVIVDLTGKFLSSDRRIRVKTNMEIYWDEVFFAEVIDSREISTTVMSPQTAELHYRGFSRTYRKGGRYGPHWFDYSTVTLGPKWRDLEGNYTRYGDVTTLLQSADNQYIISNAGDENSIRFSTENLPPLPQGWKRDFLIHSVGWVKDGDLNTAEGQQVLPLPYHGMSGYPPSAVDAYPESRELVEYQSTFNTRVISQSDFQNSLKPNSSED